jgi:hypothetical protein
MPLVIVFLLAFAAIMANTIKGPNSVDQDRNQQRASVLATQMNWYHIAAVQQCQAPATCPVGPIVVTHVFPGARMTFSNYFSSAYNGTLIVTTWAAGNPFYSSPYALGGLIAASLKMQGKGSSYAGAYDATTQSVAGSNSEVYDPALGYTVVSIPPNSGGLNLKTGDPILATIASP